MRTFGSIHYLSPARAWAINVEPHVALRMKRVFAKLDSRQLGTLSLLDTPENARDLEWFIERYPVECPDADYLKSRANIFREKETVLAQLLAGRMPALHFPMALPPREYQEQAAAVLRHNKQLLLADDVGLGKTVSAIAAFIEPEFLPVLVVTLAHLPKQWQGFVNRFAPHLSTHILRTSTPYDLRMRGRLPDVIFSSYHKIAGWVEHLAPIVRMIVWDECQELRKTGTQKYTAAQQLAEAVPCRMGLSATPIYNYGGEIFNVMECIAPGAMGSHNEFMTEWCGMGDTIAHPRAFGSYLREQGLMLRRTRADVGRELPGFTSLVETVQADHSTLEKLEQGCEALALTLLGSSESFKGQKRQAAAEFDMRMRQATGIAKAPYVAAFVRMLVEESSEPVVLYGWHRAVYEIWERMLRDLKPVMYTGSESVGQKNAARDKFIRGESKVLMISLRSGAGLDGLQEVCKTVVFGELDWSPGVHEQCSGRVYRDGQKGPVFAYYLVSSEGSDPVVSDTLGLKSQQIEGIRNPSGEFVTKLEVDPDHVKKLAAAYLKKRGFGPPPQDLVSPEAEPSQMEMRP